MFFNCNISVVIGNKTVQTVISVNTKNESAKIGSECDLKVPILCRIQYTDGKHDFLTAYPKNLFNVGDPITVTASYDGYPTLNIFNGYVTAFNEGDEITIKCTDNIFLLNQTTVNLSYKNITIKDLITNVLNGTSISLLLPTMDLQLENISFRLMSPAAILEWLKKELGINISLTGQSLYVNVASNTLDQVIYRTDRNVIKSNLQTPTAIFQQFKVKAWFIQENGTKDSLEVGDSNGQLHEVFFYKVPRNMAVYQNLAAEALNKVKQHKYSGTIETLLYPDVKLFDTAQYTDIRYPDRNGNYVVTSNDIDLDDKGFFRKIKLAYLSGINDTTN